MANDLFDMIFLLVTWRSRWTGISLQLVFNQPFLEKILFLKKQVENYLFGNFIWDSREYFTTVSKVKSLFFILYSHTKSLNFCDVINGWPKIRFFLFLIILKQYKYFKINYNEIIFHSIIYTISITFKNPLRVTISEQDCLKMTSRSMNNFGPPFCHTKMHVSPTVP